VTILGVEDDVGDIAANAHAQERIIRVVGFQEEDRSADGISPAERIREALGVRDVPGTAGDADNDLQWESPPPPNAQDKPAEMAPVTLIST
jgi:hypothetical protein